MFHEKKPSSYWGTPIEPPYQIAFNGGLTTVTPSAYTEKARFFMWPKPFINNFHRGLVLDIHRGWHYIY
jgi:hypothetical protein